MWNAITRTVEHDHPEAKWNAATRVAIRARWNAAIVTWARWTAATRARWKGGYKGLDGYQTLIPTRT